MATIAETLAWEHTILQRLSHLFAHNFKRECLCIPLCERHRPAMIDAAFYLTRVVDDADSLLFHGVPVAVSRAHCWACQIEGGQWDADPLHRFADAAAAADVGKVEGFP